MKPPEILGMLEEAAGTKMYEVKKQQAEKTIEKKDAKLREIEEVILLIWIVTKIQKISKQTYSPPLNVS